MMHGNSNIKFNRQLLIPCTYSPTLSKVTTLAQSVQGINLWSVLLSLQHRSYICLQSSR